MFLLPHHSSLSNNFVINIYVKVILLFTAASKSLTSIHYTAKISAYWRINIIPIYGKDVHRRTFMLSGAAWFENTLQHPGFLTFTFLLCTLQQTFLSQHPSVTAVWQTALVWKWPPCLLSVFQWCPWRALWSTSYLTAPSARQEVICWPLRSGGGGLGALLLSPPKD